MTAPARPLPTVNAVIYRRVSRLNVPTPDGEARKGEPFRLLSAAFQAYGLVMERPLFERLAALSDAQVQTLAAEVLPVALSQFGAHRTHVPLFKNFPRQTPQDTYVYYVQRLIAYVLRDPGQPCALDGDNAPRGLSRLHSVTPRRACTYGMFNPEEFGGCPICHRRVGPEDEPGKAQKELQESRERLQWLRQLNLETNRAGTVRELLTELLSRTTPLPPQDRDDLRVLLADLGTDALPLLPEKVPQRETMALMLGTLLMQPHAREAILVRLDEQVRTATDLLRVLDAAAGGDASLTGPNRAVKLPRPVRRAMLARLNALDAQNLTEDLGRHASRWKKMGETLHPFEYARQFPQVAVAFAALRGTTPQEDALGALLRAAPETLPGLSLQPQRAAVNRTGPRQAIQTVAQVDALAVANAHGEVLQHGRWKEFQSVYQRKRKEGLAAREQARLTASIDPHTPHPPRLRFIRWAGRVEHGLAARQPAEVLRLLKQRPGELGRRLDALLRLTLSAQPALLPQVTQAVQDALPRLNTPMLLLLRSHLGARAQPWPTRLVFPKASPQSFAIPDRRDPLGADVTAPIMQAIQDELLSRAARLPRYPAAVLDERLKDLPVPFAERETARALVTLARGAKMKLPAGRFARLFVYWMEHEQQRLDLDLSATMYDPHWRHVGHCNFTNLRFAHTGAVHSGDLTSAPAPLGASEFIDLDVPTLLGAGVRYVVMSVMSFNGVPFENMAEAFAGYMLREHADGQVFDARTVEQRYDLRGKQQVNLPLALDLQEGTLHWLDTVPKARELGEVAGHQVGVYTDVQALAARRIIESAALHARPTLWDVAALHAAARVDEVTIWHEDGTFSRLQRAQDSPSAFLARLNDGQGEATTSISDRAALAFHLYRHDPLPPGSVAHALRDSVVNEQDVERRTYAQAVTELIPI